MNFAIIILAIAVVSAALIFAFARRPAPEAVSLPLPDPRLDVLLAKQGEIGGQFTQTVAAQEALTRILGERLEALEKRLGANLADGATKTAASLAVNAD